MAKNYFNRYVWLLETIQSHGHITLSDLSDLWQRSSLNDNGSPLAERTFHNHKDAILEMFGIEIRFDKSLGYYLGDEDLHAEGIREWLMASLSTNNLLNECSDMRSRILFEDIPSGQKYLHTIIDAMREGNVLEMTYQKFYDDRPYSICVKPYCVRVSKQRWYLLAAMEKGSESPRLYGLDRIRQLQVTRRTFRLPQSFDAESYFAGCFGIVKEEGKKVEDIYLKVWGRQREYFKTLPLHQSQEIVLDGPDEKEEARQWSVFRYRMAPTWDLERELLSLNDWVEVLKPASLRESIIEHARNILDLYGEKCTASGQKYSDK